VLYCLEVTQGALPKSHKHSRIRIFAIEIFLVVIATNFQILLLPMDDFSFVRHVKYKMRHSDMTIKSCLQGGFSNNG